MNEATPSDTGAPVIDVGTSVQPDTRPRPSGDPVDLHDGDDSDAMFEGLGDAYDDAIAKAAKEELDSPPLPDRPGERLDETVERAHTHVQRLHDKRERPGVQLEHQAHAKLDEIIKSADEFNIRVKNADGSIDANALQAVRALMGETAETAANNPAPSEIMRTLIPDAENAADAEAKLAERVAPFVRFQEDFAQRGSAAIVDAAKQLGANSIIDVNNPVHAAHAAAAYHGWSLDQIARHAGYLPVEEVQQLLQQRDPETIGSRALLDEWARDKPDFEDIRQEMGELITKDPKFQQLENESTLQHLSRVYERVKRDRKRRGYVPKSAIDKSIEAVAEKAYGGAA